jgi:hypothetical protein
MNDDPAEKQRLLEQAKALSERPKFVRYLAVTQLIFGAVASGIHDEAEIFDAAYGDPTGLDYWAAYLTVPIPVALLANTLSAHTARDAEDRDNLQFAILCAFRGAAEAGERWFVGSTGPLLAVEEFGQTYDGLDRVRVEPRAAIEWLLSKSIFERFVPESLVRHLQSSEPQAGVGVVDQQVPAAPDSKSSFGAKTKGIMEALNQLWPGGIPKAVSAKERDRKILEWLREKNYSLPTNPARTIQRALIKRRSNPLQ